MDAAKINACPTVSCWFILALLGVALAIVALIAGPSVLERLLVAGPTFTRADALVVMAGSRERLPAAVRLYQQGAAAKVLLTNDGVIGGWSTADQRNLAQVEWARRYLLNQGVPDAAIVMLPFSRSGSYYDALHARDYVLAAGGIKKLLVVTSDYHTRRTLWTFRRILSATDVVVGVYPVRKDPDYRGRRLRILSLELIKFIYYQLRYGLLPPA